MFQVYWLVHNCIHCFMLWVNKNLSKKLLVPYKNNSKVQDRGLYPFIWFLTQSGTTSDSNSNINSPEL